MEEITLYVPAHASHKRLDLYITTQITSLSRSKAKKLIEDGNVLVDGLPSKPSNPLKGGEIVRVLPVRLKVSDIEPEDIPLDIIYEDKDIIVINKPAGLVVHPGAGVLSGTLVNAVIYHCGKLSGVGGQVRPGIVHRLDKDTSGVIVVAKDDTVHNCLAKQFKDRNIKKTYMAIVWGSVKPCEGVIDFPIGRHPYHRTKMSTVSRKTRDAFTNYTVKEDFTVMSLLQARPVTGRTHQIRVHLSMINHPIVGDKVYGGRRKGNCLFGLRDIIAQLKGHALHAHTISFFHPKLRKQMDFAAPLPEDFSKILLRLRGDKGR